jgi:dimethylamine/trimethylamine dehydrogenase
VVVYDCEGYYTAASVAEQLALDGHDVQLVTSLALVAPLCEHTLERELLCARLDDLGVAQRTGTTVTRIDPGLVRCADAFGKPLDLEADGIVLVTQRVAQEELYRELAADPGALEREGIEGLYRIGDCAAPRLLADAIFDGHRLAREIDGPDPALPRPHRQERVVTRRAPGRPARGR